MTSISLTKESLSGAEWLKNMQGFSHYARSIIFEKKKEMDVERWGSGNQIKNKRARISDNLDTYE